MTRLVSGQEPLRSSKEEQLFKVQLYFSSKTKLASFRNPIAFPRRGLLLAPGAFSFPGMKMQMFLVHQVWNILIFIITLICKCHSKIWTYGNVWMLAVVFLMGETVLCCWGFLVEPSPRELSPSTLWRTCWDQNGSLGVTHTLGYERCPDFFSFLVDHGS